MTKASPPAGVEVCVSTTVLPRRRSNEVFGANPTPVKATAAPLWRSNESCPGRKLVTTSRSSVPAHVAYRVSLSTVYVMSYITEPPSVIETLSRDGPRVVHYGRASIGLHEHGPE